jgi:hypothetical protein
MGGPTAKIRTYKQSGFCKKKPLQNSHRTTNTLLCGTKLRTISNKRRNTVRKNIGKMTAIAVLGALFLVAACDSGQPPAPQPLPQVPVPMQVAPMPTPPVQAQPQVVVPPPPPATPLIPVSDTPPAAEPKHSSGKGTGVGNIDKALPGPKTPGDELIGPYTCAIDSKKLTIGPFKAPPFGCRIYRSQSDDSLKIGSSSEGAGSLKGDVTDQTAVGFFVNAKYDLSGNKMAIKAKMKLSGADQYVGKGRGRFNDDKKEEIEYKLTMTRKK